GVREALQKTDAPVIAVSPIVGGAAVSGPAANLMQAAGLPVSIEGIARAYADFLDALVADGTDRETRMLDSHIDLLFTNTIMKADEDKLRLAQFILDAMTTTGGKVAVG
ncbi:MAG: hypothetical protein ACXWC1_33425, partial [Burkholderiales bacterium]